MKRIARVIIAFAVFVGTVFVLPETTFAYDSDNPDYKGYDVSYWQGRIDWESAKDELDFVIFRLAHGSQIDTYFDYNASMCEKYHIPYGVYVYSTATTVSGAKKDAKRAIAALKQYSPDLPVFWDIEETSTFKTVSTSKLAKMAFAFCDKISDAGYKAGVYSSAYYWYLYLDKFAKKDDTYSHWVAQYHSDYCVYGDEEAIEDSGVTWAYNKDYHRYDIWQYGSTDKVSWDDSVYIDGDYWYGTLGLTKLKKLSGLSNAITLKWKRATSAKKYVIYRKEGEGGTYEKIDTTEENTYTDKSVKSGKKYYYKIRVVTGTSAKDTSNVKAAWYLKTPTLKAVKNKSGKKLKVTWKKSGGSGGYEVQYSAGKNFKKAKTVKVKGKNTLKTTIKGLKKKKTYYVRVRAYKDTDDGRIYSKWSGVIQVKIKK